MLHLVNQAKNSISKSYESLFKKGSFIQNFAFVFTGSAVGLLLQLIFAPIIARIYGPDAYGVYAIFSALVSNIGSLATLYYANAFVIPKEEKDFYPLLHLSVLLSVGFSLLVFLISVLFKEQIVSLLNAEALGSWVYVVAPAILVHSLNGIMTQWNTRAKDFKIGAYRKVSADTSVKVFNVVYGTLTKGVATGLIVGDILGRTIGCILLMTGTVKRSSKQVISSFNFSNVVKAAKKYKDYPMLVLPGGYLNTLSTGLPIFMLSSAFGSVVVGNFSFTVTLLSVPISLLGNTVRPVFLQKAAETNSNKPEELPAITLRLYKFLLLIGIFPITVLTVFGDLIFGFFFGDQWLLAGRFAGFLGYFYIFSLISAPASAVFLVKGKEKIMFYFHVLLLLIRFLSLLIGIYVLADSDNTVLMFGFANAIIYFLLIIYLFRYLKIPLLKIVSGTILLVLVNFALCFFLRYLIF